MYSGLPKLAANAKAPFCMSPVAQDDRPTITRRKAKYALGLAPRNKVVEHVRSAKTTVLIMRARLMRNGYEAEYWMLLRMRSTERLVIVETVRMADWNVLWMEGAAAKREEK